MTVEENKAIVRRLIEDLWNAGNPELAEQLYAVDYVRHGPLADPPIRGSEALKHFASMYLAVVPDLHHEIEVSSPGKIRSCHARRTVAR